MSSADVGTHGAEATLTKADVVVVSSSKTDLLSANVNGDGRGSSDDR